MFTIALDDHQPYKTYILTDQLAQSRLDVVPERGGIITRWQLRGQDLLYLDTERFANPSLSVRGGIPILFPICGNLPNNAYSHDGNPYTLTQHGFARDLPWAVTERLTQDGVGLVLTLVSNEQTRSHYPFDFELTFTYRLQGSSLLIHQRYTNHSPQPMPFSTGLHPYFLTSDKTQLQFDIPGSEYLNQRDQTRHSFSGAFDFDLDEIDAAFFDVSQPSARVADLGRNLRLTLDYDPIYSTLVFWTIKGKDYYCLEPWTAGRNALNTGDRLIRLDPGTSLDMTIKLTINAL